ncbi:MAG: hypothetical protein HQ559_07375 [Lentisphaerae bacterium]|nr:hypothetical protein [Lentisphaerota bacterium]
MKRSVRLSGGLLSACCVVLVLAAVTWAQGETAAGATGLKTVPPRHRVAVLTVPHDGAESETAPAFVLKTDAWKALLAREGIAIGENEWAGAGDLLKAAIAGSGLLRTVEMPASWQGGKTAPTRDASAPDALLLARFGVGNRGRSVFLRLVEPHAGVALAQVEARAENMKRAVAKVLKDLEDEMSLLPWRCRITGVDMAGKAMVVDRGYLDGLREGQRFVGFALQGEAKDRAGLSDEKAMMLHGRKKGVYELTEVGQNVSRVASVDGAPMLSVGDVLQLPEIRLRDRTRPSRGRRLWDKVYRKRD